MAMGPDGTETLSTVISHTTDAHIHADAGWMRIQAGIEAVSLWNTVMHDFPLIFPQIHLLFICLAPLFTKNTEDIQIGRKPPCLHSAWGLSLPPKGLLPVFYSQ